MAKRNKRGNQNTPPKTQKKASTSPQTIKNIEEEMNSVKAISSEKGVAVPRNEPIDDSVQITDGMLKNAYTEANRVKETYNRLAKHIEKQELDLKEREGSISEKEKDASDQLALANEKLKKANDLSNDAADRTREVIEREANIDAGYAEKNWETLQSLEETKQKIIETIENSYSLHSEKVADVITQTSTQYEELSKLAAKVQDSVTKSVQSELQLILEDLAKERIEYANIQRLRKDVEIDRKILDEDQENFRSKLEEVYEARSLEDKQTIERLAASIKQKEEAIENFQLEIARIKASTVNYKDLSVEETTKLIEGLQNDVESLNASLQAAPSQKDYDRLVEKEALFNTLHEKYEELIRDNMELNHSQLLSGRSVLELESLQFEVDTQKQMAEVYRQKQKELRNEIDGLLDQSSSGTSFEQLIQIDKEPDYQSVGELTEDITDLKQFTDDLRNRLKYASGKEGVELYYSKEDVRRFIGGLAMSRLHILQGISGTGKTSLARAFADSIGAGYQLVPAQAGWRDRYDLIGHFNSFTKKYQETPFIKGLYEAQTPLYINRPYIILIDEMNLSRVEHYFADILSLLEVGDEEKFLEVRWTPQGSAPELFTKDMRHLELPENVWFIGTANHDETTVEFADKTYDRSHVMELPTHPETFPAPRPAPRSPVALETLQTLFSEAAHTYSDDATKTKTFLETHLRQPMQSSFNIGWGNRLNKQIETFVPVVRACGGSLTEAVDHLITTKLLRKIRDRHNVLQSSIESMSETLLDVWSALDGDNIPEQSISLLENEARKKGGSIR